MQVLQCTYYWVERSKDTNYKKAIDEKGIKHCWLINSYSEIIDPTAEQYSELDRPFPYHRITSNQASYRKTKTTNMIISNVKAKLSENS
ncbi:hypothetical protein [Yersinia mollaretii]|uniref:hypothetical protein n=1 Tax=Yersinia mollaretii TaxID=33060 RepID=UPI0012D466DB|nr:hypothetical protein [Yersinia mollaretii]